MSQAESAYTASQAAAEIHELMNTRPTLPHRHELEAIIAKVRLPDLGPYHRVVEVCSICESEFSGLPVFVCNDYAAAEERERWRELALKWDGALDHANALEEAARGNETAETKAARAAEDREHQNILRFEDDRWARAGRSLADVELLANLLAYQLWPGYGLTEIFDCNERSSPKTLEQRIAEGPCCEGERVDTAIGALLIAIRNALSPLALDPADVALMNAVREAITAHETAERQSLAVDDMDPALNLLVAQRWQELWAALDRIPQPPTSPIHLLLLAEIAWHGGDKTPDNLRLQTSEDCFERPAGKLVEAVLAFLGAQACLKEVRP